MPPMMLKVIAEWRNRIETTFSEITDRMELARHGAHSFWGLLTRTVATIAAHTLLLTCLAEASASSHDPPERPCLPGLLQRDHPAGGMPGPGFTRIVG